VKIGLLLPSTNTVAETEYWQMLPWGVTVHAGRMLVTQTEVGTDRDYLYLNDQMFAALEPTLANLLTCRPDHLALAMSAMSFAGGAAADPALRQRLAETSGVPVTSGPSACLAAVRAVGASRIGLLSPFQPAVEAETARWFAEHDVEVVTTYSFLAQTTLAIAAIGPDDARAALVALDDERVEAFVQVGTNVQLAGLAAAAEWWLGRPVIHVNTAMVWDILRAQGVPQAINGFGVVLEEN
jgi:maleate isomerase